MSLKRYFEDKSNRSTKIITDKSSESLLKEDEFSHNFVISREKVLKRFIPRIDYSKPENFAYFGNAERYYEDSIKRIYQTYPYDDSPQEKEDWFLSSSFIDLYVYNSKYPKSTGYVIFSPSGWSTAASTADGYGNPATKEYIYVKGGPHVGSVYDESQNKESNLKLDGDKGNTVEFYLKKSEFVNSLTQKEVIFDCATNDSDISTFGSSYGRFRVELDGNAGGSPFLVTYSSGSNGASSVVVGSNITKATIADDKWHHYAVSVHNTGSNLEINLYIDGKLNHSVRSGTTCAGNKVNMNANVGALVTSVSNGSSTGIGWGKLSGSLDEFRFWKIKRTGEQIGDNWRTQVPGGTSHKDIDGNLGVYYKFNEGITTNDDTDKVVLDYSGRVSNGNWIGYSNAARNTGSAIKQSGANVIEFEDPIIRSNHPSVVALLEELKDIGRNHDMLNSSALFSTFPSWMIQDDADPYKGDSKLAELVQIISSYFDTLYIQTKVLPGLKSKGYSDYSSPQHLSGSKPSPFSDKLLRSSGFIAPDLFVESNVIERILSKDAGREYEQDLSDVKNLIYKNIYNNIVHIYKTKGTEQSFRNIMRCFGIDDEIIKTNLYSTGYTYSFSDTYQYKAEKVKGINFNHPDHFSATVFQQTSSYGNVHYMSGNADIYTPYTFESNVVFPLKIESSQKGFFNTTFTSASIFGVHTPLEAAGNTNFASGDPAGIQIYAVHHPKDTKAAKFVLKSSAGNIPTLETKFFNDVYDDRHWVLSARIKPDAYPYSSQAVPFVKASGTITTTGNPSNNEEFTLTDAAGTSVTFIFKTSVATVDGTKESGKVIIGVNGATGHAASVGDRMRAAITASDLKVTVVETSGGAMTLTQDFSGASGNTAIDMTGVTTVTSTDFTGGRGSYTVNFTGYNYILDELQESFDLSGSASVADLGGFSPSRKAMYAGANRTNFNSTLQQSSDVIVNSVRAWRGYLENEEIKSHSLSFEEYGRIHPSRNEFLFQTGSNTTQISQISTLMLHWDFAQVTGSDSNGSFFVADTSRKPTGSFGPNNSALNTYHGGVGFGFPSSSEKFVKGTVLPVAKENLPENVLNSSLVTIEERDKVRFTRESRPINYYYAFEKSMYQTISEEMVKMFATIKEFNNLIGEPVNKYRKTYKSLDYLRSLFFSNVQADPDLDKYIEFYKWFDNSLGLMLEEVIPFSLPGTDGIKNMVESHILERNKYEHKAPTLEFKTKDTVFPIAGLRELLYDWEHGHAPLPGYWASFDGTDDFIQVADHNDFSFGDSTNDSMFTLSAWVVFDDPTSNVQSIIGKYNANTASEYLFFNNNGYLQVNLYDLNTSNKIQSKTNSVVFESGRLYHVAMVYSGEAVASGITLFVDGVAPAQTRSSSGTYNAMHNTATALQFGSTVAGSFDFSRNMHHVMVIANDVSAANILKLYNLYDDGILSVDAQSFADFGLITSWWKMDKRSLDAGSVLDSIGNHHGTLNGDAHITPEYVIFGKQNKNCLWWEEREERGDLLRTNTLVDANREKIRVKVNSDVSGSTYALRRFSRPYRFGVEVNRSYNVGSNVQTNKINNFYQSTIKFGSTSDAIELNASDLQDQEVCDDVFGSNQKERLSGKADTLGTTGYLDADIDMVMPFSLYSSSLDSQPLALFKDNVIMTNNHHDSYHVEGSIPLQGIFTSKHVGGRPHRNVDISVRTPEHRPEAYNLEVTANKIKLLHQPVDRPRSMFYKNEKIRRPVNIRNIKSETESFARATGTISTTGNPSNDEEFVLTDTNSLSVTFIFKTGVATVDGSKSDGKVIIGVSGASGHAPSVGDRIRAAISASDLDIDVRETSGGSMILTQRTAGPSGNTEIDMSGVTTVTSTNFSGGAEFHKAGNYSEVYEYVLTNGRKENNSDFAANNGHTGSSFDSVLSLADGILDQKKISRAKNTHVIVGRFSSPGGTETMGDSDGGPNLDYAAAEYSVYNSLNHRNSLVRGAKNELDAEHSQRFGLRNLSSLVEGSYEIVKDSDHGFASSHKVQRNELTKHVVTSTVNFNTKAVLFDGTNDYLEIDETRAIYKNNNEFSVFAWIKHSAADTSFQHTIWSHHTSGGANREIFGIKGTTTNNGVTAGTLFFYQEGLSWQSLSSTRVDDGEWHLVGFTYEGTSNSVRLFVDGVAQPGSITIANIAEQVNDSNDKVSIGQEWDNGSASDFFKGHMANLSIWSKELSPNEVYEIYSDGQHLGPHQLTRHTAAKYLEAWYRMGDGDNGSGTDDSYNVAIYDMSKNSFHAVPTNLAADAIKDVESTLPGVLSIYTKGSAKDNKFVSHPIPRNEIQYSWITASSTDTRDSFIGHKHDFAVPRAIESTYQKEISFLTSSVSHLVAGGQNYYYTSNFSRLNYMIEQVNPAGTHGVELATASIDLNTNTLTPSWHSSWGDNDYIPFRHFLAGNSPYNHATWRQIRGGEHPITRGHNKNNNISIHLRNGIPNSKPFMDYSRPHNISSNLTEVNDRVISNYQEPPVTSQYKPVRLLYGIVLEDRLGELREDALENGLNLETTKVRTFGPAKSEVEMHVTYGNAMCKFANRDLMDVLELEDIENTRFDDLLRVMREPEGPNDIAQPFGFVYAETVYPAEVNAYQKETRLRTAFVSKVWRETRELRLQPLTKSFSTPSNEESYKFYHNHPTETTTGQTNSQGLAIFDSGSAFGVLYINQSMWPLDARSDFSDRPETLFTSSVSWEPSQVEGFRQRVYGELRDSGELQNGYSIFHHGPTATRDDIVTAAIYNRRIQQTAGNRTYLAGESKWEAGDQAGKYPFEKDYNAWAEDLKSAQDFSLLPEFRISEHIPSLLETGNISTPIENFLQLTGSSLSSQDNTFFKTYSNSDFMKYFSVVKESLEEMGQNPNSLFLKCSAMLKMLPYEGFYPATRTLKIAEIFQQEYTNHNFDVTDIIPDPTQSEINAFNGRVSTNSRTNLHLASKMLYAPGVLYNSIKSGVAVDYPIFSQNGDGKWDNNIIVGLIEFSLTASNPSAVGTLWNTTEGLLGAKYGSLFTGSYVNDTHAADLSIPRIKGDEYRRVSFEDMLDPSNLAGMILYDNEPHPSASYGMFAFTHNQRGKELDCHPLYGTLFSGSTTGPDRASTGAILPNHWGDNLPIASAGDTIKYSLAMHNFCAEVPNFFLKNRALTSIVSEPGPYFFNRDEIDQVFSMFVKLKNSDILMYDNPSAFGPPVDNTTGTNDSYGFDPYTPSFLKKNAQPFVELSFKPTKRKYTLDEIQGELTASFNIGNRATSQLRYGTNAAAQMTLSASLNLFGRVDEPNIVADKDGNPFQVIDRDEPRSRWLIQTKWETPVLNFKDVDMTLFDPTGSAKAVSLSEAFSEDSVTPWSVTGRGHSSSYLTGSRGMWHQYGRLPTEQEGYFLQISDPSKFEDKRSLASKVGFPVGVNYRVGELAETKEISEAVVAIPYYVSRDGDLDFFELGREDVREILGEFDALSALRGDVPLTPGVNPQIRHQIEMMQKYNFPPQFDFIRYRDKNPIAMYVFEFSYNLDKQDLADLWQNLPAKIGLRGEGFSEKTVGHRLVKNGEVLDPLSGEVKEKMQWMVFKVKKKAEINYFKKSEDSIFQSSGKEGNKLRDGKTQVLIDQLAQKFARLDGYSYNWPYDYFSLVELIKVDAEVTFRPNEDG